MPMIHIEYDNEKVAKEDILSLSSAIQKIVSEVTKIEDVFVYGNSAEVKIKTAPVEIFVRMSAHIMEKNEAMIEEIKNHLAEWKKENDFTFPINLTLIPMNWKMEIGI